MKRHLAALFVVVAVTISIGCQESPLALNNADSTLVEVDTEVIEIELNGLDDFDSMMFGDPHTLKPVVQFSCAVSPTPTEDALEVDLQGRNDEKRLAALKKLVEVSAPSSVPLQHSAFLALKGKYPDHATVNAAEKAFDRERITAAVLGALPRDDYSREMVEFHWCIRAAGVLQMRELLPRLLELSATGDLDAMLAAERSIEDFDGPEGEDALLHVISLWKYNAFQHAAHAMTKRNPERLSYTLEQIAPPGKYRYSYALILARCGNAKAVPYLCSEIEKVNTADREMFKHIAELGTEADRERIVNLPTHVRPDQRELAEKCVEEYLKRVDGALDE